ncbi:hypothetical protein LYSHEL_01830 [Lysobacter helvus]|uniref:Aspartyl protease n=2 Tax=Lysobacteraceae TaxID=32033 RepID=A0ABM7Q1V1_9GAMM|nr:MULTISPECIES: hypothetical protein [Lysobacter]BCT91159.1 hypothetical protein LYSCAS_01830 [Lysobacter caseinilyticus]BCT94312.1 hypothetical protein LYSHEL_01830 [Lysobacter helvus]
MRLLPWCSLVCLGVLMPAIAQTQSVAATPPPAVTAAPVATLTLEPFRRSVAVRVDANGTKGLFAFDTAGGHSIASPEFAAAAGCKPWGELGGFTMTGTKLAMPRCDGLQFDVDGHRLTAPVAGVMQVAPLIAKDAPPIAGLLALDVFAGQTITIDFAGGKLYIESPASAAQRIVGARELPVRLSHEVQGLALAVNLEVPTPQGIARFELDSGNGGTLLVSRAYAKLFGLDPQAKAPTPGTIPIAPGIAAKGLVFVTDMNIDGNLGMPFLKDWIVTLDLAAGRMWLQPTRATPPPEMGVPPALPAK